MSGAKRKSRRLLRPHQLLEFMRSIKDRQQSVSRSTIQFSAPTSAELAARGSYSQLGQDLLVLLLFSGKGTFVDIGAHDGITASNTKLLEDRGWKGIAVEPNRKAFEDLRKNRKAISLPNAVGATRQTVEFTAISGYAEMLSGVTCSYASEHRRRIQRELQEHGGDLETYLVEQITLADVFTRGQLEACDYMSIDVEGAEEDICYSLASSPFRPRLISVENNYQTSAVRNTLGPVGYRILFSLEWDDFYLHESVSFLPAMPSG